ncbi:hypothetical protein Tcan_16030 [Toxocara canis]|uniref:Uncharacterized protein n=1 Tax=Toxocara canis TaxID=6265 RepID=A0A0B2VYP4_TOXCA|nr:hypothetical protein Tcan_16030 [Toxocara canis]
MSYASRIVPSNAFQHHGLVARQVAAYSSKGVTESTATKQPEKVYEQPLHATKMQYRASMQDQRTNRTYDAETGVKPTKWQRRFLVLTSLYRNMSEIPEYISSATMQRMHNRLRVVFIIVACTWFYLLFFTIERGWAHVISKNKSSGHSVSKID